MPDFIAWLVTLRLSLEECLISYLIPAFDSSEFILNNTSITFSQLTVLDNYLIMKARKLQNFSFMILDFSLLDDRHLRFLKSFFNNRLAVSWFLVIHLHIYIFNGLLKQGQQIKWRRFNFFNYFWWFLSFLFEFLNNRRRWFFGFVEHKLDLNQWTVFWKPALVPSVIIIDLLAFFILHYFITVAVIIILLKDCTFFSNLFGRFTQCSRILF
jgi:hypothetical protein